MTRFVKYGTDGWVTGSSIKRAFVVPPQPMGEGIRRRWHLMAHLDNGSQDYVPIGPLDGGYETAQEARDALDAFVDELAHES